MNQLVDLVQAGAMEALDLVIEHAPGIAYWSIRGGAVGAVALLAGFIGLGAHRARADR